MRKINETGEYTPFCGWTTISNVQNSLHFIEKFLVANPILKKYFSALPASSYHMTLYNIWCNGKNIIPYQKQCQKNLIYNPNEYGFYNPQNCMDALLQYLQCILNEEEWDIPVFKCSDMGHWGSNLTILVGGSEDTLINQVQIDRIRQKLMTAVNVDDKMPYYHITLAYQYQEIPENMTENVAIEIKKLYQLVIDNQILLSKPFIASFKDMTKFTPCFNNSKHCLGFLVPEIDSHEVLKNFGVDITTPMRSFKVNPTPFEQSTTFGGIHVSIFRRREYNKDCVDQIKNISEEFKKTMGKPWTLPSNAKIIRGNFQSTIVFESLELQKISKFAKLKGWPQVVTENFHIGLYSSSLQTRPTEQQEYDILNYLKSVKWGFILSVDNGDKKFKFDWNTFTCLS